MHAPLPVCARPLPSVFYARPAAAEERFWHWRETLASLFDVAVGRPEAVATFDARLDVHAFGAFLVLRLGGTAQILRRSAATIVRSRLDHHLVLLHRGGACTLDCGDRAVRMGAGDVAILDLARPVEIVTADFDDIALVVHRDVLLAQADRVDAFHGVVLRMDRVLGPILGAHMERLSLEAPRLRQAEARLLAPGSLALLAACVGGGMERRSGSEPASVALVEIRRHIERELASPCLGTDALMERFNLSRATLYRIFLPQGGVAGYIRERRLARVLHDITAQSQSHRRIGDIAYDWGFTNETSFSRSFSRSFGLSPREARITAMLFDAVGSMSPTGATFMTWMRNLSAQSL